MSNVSEEYATALFDSLKTHEEKTQSLQVLRAMVDVLNKETSFYEGIQSKEFKTSEVKKVFSNLSEALQCNDQVKNFLQLLVDKKRINLLPNITECFQDELDKESGITRGVVKSAQALSPAQREELEEKFSKKLNKKVILTYQEDKKVLAGVRVELDAYTFDDTVETHIKNIKEDMNRSAN